ncbi:hypothetical protein MPRF_12960 [Mycolicibacterium parafortuitum]|uniref:Uncharacterized protein n=1 Tax=Mycolicibacterium parafortuitum TaxID=39692 RepID=A0A7I7TZ03_MYCPF|nr:hypothetical protein MPRF_12960 [Mycolicibacterium parafortuitum]
MDGDAADGEPVPDDGPLGDPDALGPPEDEGPDVLSGLVGEEVPEGVLGAPIVLGVVGDGVGFVSGTRPKGFEPAFSG